MGTPTIPTTRGSGKHGPKHVPTEEMRIKVRALAGYGLPQADIARIIGLSEVTMTKHYRREIQEGRANASAGIAQSLYRQAINGNVTAAIYWTKARMGWSDHAAEIYELTKTVLALREQLDTLRAARGA